jgi:hypothetical protein
MSSDTKVKFSCLHTERLQTSVYNTGMTILGTAGLLGDRRVRAIADESLRSSAPEPIHWQHMKPNDLTKLRNICQEGIKKYYERLDKS